MSKTRVALFGAGFIADIHAESYHRFVPDAEAGGRLLANRKPRAGIGQRHGIARWSTDLEESLARTDYDVADICLPNHLHARVTIAAAAAGKHVILEKPLCLTLEEADAMIAACKATQPKADVCRGAVLRAEVRAGPSAHQRRRRRIDLLHASVRKALGTTQRLVL